MKHMSRVEVLTFRTTEANRDDDPLVGEKLVDLIVGVVVDAVSKFLDFKGPADKGIVDDIPALVVA